MALFKYAKLAEAGVLTYDQCPCVVYAWAFILYEAGTLPKKDYTAYLNRFSSNVATLGDQVWWLEARSFCNTALVEAIYKKFAEETLPDKLGLGLFALDSPEPAEAN